MMGSKPRCVKINIDSVNGLGVEVDENPPEEFIQPEIKF